MNQDIQSSHYRGDRKPKAKRSILGRKTNQPSLMQGAIRIEPTPTRAIKKEFPFRRTAIIAAFFIFSALIATISNGNTGDLDNNSAGNLLNKAVINNGSVADPDFYFIDSNQFVPGSLRLQTAAYSRPAEEPDISLPKPLDNPSLATPASEDIKAVTPLKQIDKPVTVAPKFLTSEISVKSGDTLSELLVDNGVEASELYRFLSNEHVRKHLTTLRINQKLSFRRHTDGNFASLSVRLGQERKLLVSRGTDGFAGSVIELPLRREVQAASANIDSSLFLAGQSAGLSQKTIMNLVDIFQWDVDFGLDIRKGDTFKVIYEKLYRDGEYLGEGDILAAEFVNTGRTIRAIRYTDFNGRTSYYTPEGRSMRKAFLRNPVDVVRITSHFNPNRKHPVLHTIRAHKGTDYGAPIGTPIRSSGDGKVIYAGVKGGYGNTVVIKHGDKYTTLYAHMSKFAKAMKSGKRVKQGQIIGYVGKSGRVTGAHLHYEFRINGVHKNPLKVKLPGARPLPDKFKADFSRKSRDLLVALDKLDTQKVALNAK